MTAAIRSGSDDAQTMTRANACLALYFQPDEDAETKMAIRQAFVRALDGIPVWAMLKAFDDWERSSTRRPTPGEIVILAGRILKPFYDEIKRRTPPPPEPPRPTPSPERAAQIMAEAGFTPKRMEAVRAAPMAGSFDEAVVQASTPAIRHWSETATPDDPRWAILRASRANNVLMKGPTE